MKKTTPAKVENVTVEVETQPIVVEEPKTDFYDGVEDVYYTGANLQPMARKMKVNLNTTEADEFLKGANPNKYFREGKIPMSCVKAFGDLLPDDYEEVRVMKDVCKGFDGLLMFKNRKQNLYTILVPKELSDFELTESGDYIEPTVLYDIRVVNFSGGAAPAAFERGYFQKFAQGGNGRMGMVGYFAKAKQKRAGFI